MLFGCRSLVVPLVYMTLMFISYTSSHKYSISLFFRSTFKYKHEKSHVCVSCISGVVIDRLKRTCSYLTPVLPSPQQHLRIDWRVTHFANSDTKFHVETLVLVRECPIIYDLCIL